jgi:acyl-coenzyme A thioesterase PaaI-like protein
LGPGQHGPLGPGQHGPLGPGQHGPLGPGADLEGRTRAAAAVRRLVHGLVGRQLDGVLLSEIATRAEQLAHAVEASPVRRRHPDGMRFDVFDRPVADGETVVHFAECPVSGPANPLSAEVTAHRDGDLVRARVVLGPGFEGAPGRAHGGAVAAMFDDVMGFLATVHAIPTYAGELTVRYLAPTPLEEALDVTAWVSERRPRRLITEARAAHRGQTVAEATCVGVIVGEDNLGRPAYDY